MGIDKITSSLNSSVLTLSDVQQILSMAGEIEQQLLMGKEAQEHLWIQESIADGSYPVDVDPTDEEGDAMYLDHLLRGIKGATEQIQEYQAELDRFFIDRTLVHRHVDGVSAQDILDMLGEDDIPF